MTTCQPAPEWLIAALTAGVAVPGATLTEVFVGQASITAGPPAVMAPTFSPAWWIVAKINGAGIRPVAAAWVTNRTEQRRTGDIYGANAAALSYTTFGESGQVPIRGEGQQALLACLSPIPEP